MPLETVQRRNDCTYHVTVLQYVRGHTRSSYQSVEEYLIGRGSVQERERVLLSWKRSGGTWGRG